MRFRLLGCCVVCLGAGFGIGYWQAPRGAAPMPRDEFPTTGYSVRAKGSPQTPAPVAPSADWVENGPPPPMFRFEGDVPPEARERALAVMRLDALRWLKENGQTHYSVPVFSSSDEGTIGSSFARAYGLSETDVTRLTEALVSVRERLRSAQLAGTKATVSPDNKSASVDLPALPELGGAAREEVLAVMQDLLGPDRWPFFEELSAESFGWGLGHFGTRDTRIEIERAEVRPYWKVRTYHVTGSFSGWTESTLDWDGLQRVAPAVADALPEAFRLEMQQR